MTTKQLLCGFLSTSLLSLPLFAESPVQALGKDAKKVTREYMTKADFAGRDLTGETYFQVRLNEAKFGDANLSGTKFEQCDLSNANFQGATLSDATVFNRVTMNDANLEGLDMQGAKLDAVNLRGANLKNTRNFGVISRTTFDGADLRGADLSAAPVPLDDVTFKKALFDDKTKFPEGVDPAKVGAVKAS